MRDIKESLAMYGVCRPSDVMSFLSCYTLIPDIDQRYQRYQLVAVPVNGVIYTLWYRDPSSIVIATTVPWPVKTVSGIDTRHLGSHYQRVMLVLVSTSPFYMTRLQDDTPTNSFDYWISFSLSSLCNGFTSSSLSLTSSFSFFLLSLFSNDKLALF